MTQADYAGFVAEFTRLSHALDPYKRTPEALAAKADAYFHALKGLPLRDVTAKADAWLEREARFPKPVEWKAQIVPGPAREVRTMTDAQAREYRRAEALHYEDEPCGCPECFQAGVSEKPLRFVPDTDAHDRTELARDPIGGRIVTGGHWAHGRELAGYYRAQADFWNTAYERGWMSQAERAKTARGSFAERLEHIFAKVAK